MLAVEVIKQLLNRFENGEGWKRFVKTSVNAVEKSKVVLCSICKKSYATEKTLKTHMLKFHKGVKQLACQSCDFKSDNDTDLKKHVQEQHKENEILDNKMDIDIINSDPDNDIKENQKEIEMFQ